MQDPLTGEEIIAIKAVRPGREREPLPQSLSPAEKTSTFLLFFLFCVKVYFHNKNYSGFPCLEVLLIKIRVKALLYKSKEEPLLAPGKVVKEHYLLATSLYPKLLMEQVACNCHSIGFSIPYHPEFLFLLLCYPH